MTSTVPEIRAVHDELEKSLTFFLGNIGPLCQRLTERLHSAMPHNPKAVTARLAAAAAAASEEAAAAGAAAEGDAAAPIADVEAAAFPRSESSPLLDARDSPLSTTSKLTTELTSELLARHPSFGGVEDTAVASPEAELAVQLKLIKAEARALSKTFDNITDWMAVRIPQFDDEDDLGGQVLGQVLSRMEPVVEEIRAVYTMESEFLAALAPLETAMENHPEAGSINKAIEVVRADTWDELEQAWRKMIRGTLIVHALLSNNLKVLRDPSGPRGRSSNTL